MNLALFCPNWVGDAVMATPALTALRRRYAGARIIGVLRPYVADVYAGGGWFDEIVPLKNSVSGVAKATFALRQRRVDLAVLFTNSFRTAVTAYLGGCRQILGQARDGRSRLLTIRVEPEKDE